MNIYSAYLQSLTWNYSDILMNFLLFFTQLERDHEYDRDGRSRYAEDDDDERFSTSYRENRDRRYGEDRDRRYGEDRDRRYAEDRDRRYGEDRNERDRNERDVRGTANFTRSYEDDRASYADRDRDRNRELRRDDRRRDSRRYVLISLYFIRDLNPTEF